MTEAAGVAADPEPVGRRGEGADLDSLRWLREALTAQQISVDEWDLPGHGLSDGDYDAEERMARVVLRVGLDANGRILPERLLHGTPRGAPPSEGMRRAQAEEAARCDAVAKLREQLGGAYITNEVTVEGLMLAHQRARSTVAGLMAGGVEYGKPVWPTPERCEVRAVLRLTGEDLRRLRSLVEPTR